MGDDPYRRHRDQYFHDAYHPNSRDIGQAVQTQGASYNMGTSVMNHTGGRSGIAYNSSSAGYHWGATQSILSRHVELAITDPDLIAAIWEQLGAGGDVNFENKGGVWGHYADKYDDDYHVDSNTGVRDAVPYRTTFKGTYFVPLNNTAQNAGGSTEFKGALFPKEFEGTAYRFMWAASFDSEGNPIREVAAFVTPKGILVLPWKGVNSDGQPFENGPRESHNDVFKLIKKNNGKVYVEFEGKFHLIWAQVHTHPNVQRYTSSEAAPDFLVHQLFRVPVNQFRNDGLYTLGGQIYGTQEEYFNGVKSLINRRGK